MSSEIGAASFGLIVGLNKFRRQLREGEEAAEGSAQRMGESLGGGVEKAMAPGITRVGQSLADLGGGMMRTGAKMTMLTAPLLAAGIGAVKVAADFDTSMTKIETLVGLSRTEVDGLRDSVRQLAGRTAAAPGELADALFFATSAGLESAAALQVVEAAAKGSAMGLGDTATIVDLSTSAMNAYGAEVLSATQATDALAMAVRLGKLEPAELAGAMGSVLPVASAMGVRFDEVGAAMAAMSRTGTNASEAATQLRSIMATLLSPSAGARDALADVGLSVEGVQRSLRDDGLLATLEMLVASLGGNVTATEAVFGNIRALSGVMDMLGGNVADTRMIFDEMTRSAGMVDAGFDRVSETAGFKMKQAWASLQEQLVQVGLILMPVVSKLADGLSTVVGLFGRLPAPMQTVIVSGLALLAVVGPLLLVFGKMVSTVGMLLIGIGKLVPLIKMIGTSAMLANPWVLAIVAALAAVALVIVHWETLKRWLSDFWEWIKNTATATIDWLKRNWTTVAAVLTGPIGIAVLAITKNWDTIRDGAQAMARFVAERFASIVSTIRGIPRQIVQAARGMWDGILDAFKDVLRGIVNLWNGIGFTMPSWTVPGWVPGVGGRTAGGQRVQVPQMRIPGLANGGNVLTGGLALVGERGREVVELPTGARVSPLDHASGALAASSSRPMHIHIEVDGREIAQAVVPHLADRERITGRSAFGQSGGRRI